MDTDNPDCDCEDREYRPAKLSDSASRAFSPPMSNSLTEDQESRLKALDDALDVLITRIEALCPRGEEMLHSLLSVEQAKKWAVSAIEHNPVEES